VRLDITKRWQLALLLLVFAIVLGLAGRP